MEESLIQVLLQEFMETLDRQTIQQLNSEFMDLPKLVLKKVKRKIFSPTQLPQSPPVE
jgi:hypothetical protein